MGLVRLIVFLALVWIVWFMIRNYLNKQTRAGQARKLEARTRAARKEKIVKCQYCDVHLPEQEALQHDSRWFCTQAHKQAFLGNSNKS